MTNLTDTFHAVQTPISIPLHRVRSLLCSAFEGGSNYWVESAEFRFAEGLSVGDFRKGGKFSDPDDYWPPVLLVPFHEGCGVIIHVSDEGDIEGIEVKELNIESLKQGLELMAWKARHHWNNFLSEDDDATTGDVFLQFCVLGEVVFG